MFRNVIYMKALNDLRCCRYYSKLYCSNDHYFASSPVISNGILCRSQILSANPYTHLQPWRYQHQETGVKLKLKNENEENKKSVREPENIVEPETLTMKEKLKKAVKEYGATVIIFHIGISLISLGTCYLFVSAGLDVKSMLSTIGLEKFITKSDVATNAGTFALAYAIHKVFAPVRIGITLGSVPFIVRYLRKIGFLKKP